MRTLIHCPYRTGIDKDILKVIRRYWPSYIEYVTNEADFKEILIFQDFRFSTTEDFTYTGNGKYLLHLFVEKLQNGVCQIYIEAEDQPLIVNAIEAEFKNEQ